MRWTIPLLGLLCLAGCATNYRYRFQLTNKAAHLAGAPGERDSLEDNQVKAEIQVGGDAILLDLTNKTSEVLQVEWSRIVLDRGDGTRTSPRPDVDLGWIAPGAKVSARLVPFVVPHSGKAALAYQQRHLELSVPLVVLRQSIVYRFQFVTQVQAL